MIKFTLPSADLSSASMSRRPSDSFLPKTIRFEFDPVSQSVGTRLVPLAQWPFGRFQPVPWKHAAGPRRRLTTSDFVQVTLARSMRLNDPQKRNLPCSHPRRDGAAPETRLHRCESPDRLISRPGTRGRIRHWIGCCGSRQTSWNRCQKPGVQTHVVAFEDIVVDRLDFLNEALDRVVPQFIVSVWTF